MMDFNSLNINDYKFYLAGSESGGDYTAQNKIGATGLYQFMPSTIQVIAGELGEETTTNNFRYDKDMQERFEDQYIKDTLSEILASGYDSYIGNQVRGKTTGELATINIYGLLAAYHLASPAAVKNFLELNIDSSDGSTYISDYIARFSNYAIISNSSLTAGLDNPVFIAIIIGMIIYAISR